MAISAIEVKSGRIKGTSGLDSFHARFNPTNSMVVGSSDCPIEEFLLGNIPLF